MSPFSVAAAQCKKDMPRKAELAWLVSRYLIGSWRLKIEQISVYLLSMMSPTDVKLARGHSVCAMASKSDILVFFGGGGLWF